MKKKIFLAATAAMVAVATAVFVYSNNKSADDDFWNRNVEALANGEGGGRTCYDTITSSDGHRIMYCPICDYIDGDNTWYAPKHSC